MKPPPFRPAPSVQTFLARQPLRSTKEVALDVGSASAEDAPSGMVAAPKRDG